MRDRTKQSKLSEAVAPSARQRIKESKDRIDRSEDIRTLESEHDGVTEDEPTSGTEVHYTYEYGEDARLAGLPKTRIFQRELAQLSDEEQQLIIDHWGNHIPLVDLARRANINAAAMRKRAERVREKLYRRLILYSEFSELKLSRIKESLPDSKL